MNPVEAFFAPGGRLSRAHPGYEARPGQLRMAQQVAERLEQGGQAMIEAATGTGKTLAYLVPALAAGRRVIVSTGTRNLQDQIAEKDLPFLAGAAGLDVSACIMKGRDNYLCRYRFARFEREPLFEDLSERDWVPRLAEWSRRTETGDRAEVGDLPDSLRMWRDVNARSDTCGGSKCPEYESCWLTRLKRRAQQARLIVVNHHLFFADLALRSAYGSVIPDYDTVIFDEAHLLEEVATLYFGEQVTSGQVDELARHAEKVAARTGGPARSGGGAAGLRFAAEQFFGPLRRRLAGRTGRQVLLPADRGGPDLEGEWAALCEALDEVLRQAPDDETVEGVEALPTRVLALRESLERILARDAPGTVYGAEMRGRGHVVLSASPIDVSQPLRERLFDRLHAVVLTSATLAVRRGFDFFVDRLGLEDPRTAIVDSSFDYPEQAALFLPKGMPEPRHPDFVRAAMERIRPLLEITEGRAFLLFTSYTMMHRVRDELEREGRWSLFVQGQGSKVALVERFRESPGAVLLGTTSFWHGVDVPGPALSLVLIDKLPFDVPSDPLVAARIDRLRQDGRDPFLEYQVPLAVLELKQGLGRLLRGASDRGIVGVLDPRLTTRRYGAAFLESLPPYRIVRDLEGCRRFFSPEQDEP